MTSNQGFPRPEFITLETGLTYAEMLARIQAAQGRGATIFLPPLQPGKPSKAAPERKPLRVQAHVGAAWAALANRLNGGQVITGELLP